MKALLSSFELYFINHQGIKKIIIAKLAVERCFELNGSKKLLSFYSVRLLHSILTRVMSFKRNRCPFNGC